MKLIKKYKELNFENKTTLMAFLSIILNVALASGKFLICIFKKDIFFLIAGLINLFVLMAKSQCYLGIKNKKNKPFESRNKLTSVFLVLAGLIYSIYMLSLFLFGRTTMKYGMILGIIIALISFIELAIAIRGLFVSFGKGHYYRNIKIINFTGALTAIVMTQIALLSFASNLDHSFINGITGFIVGIIMIILGVHMFTAHKYSIVDREYNEYKLIDGKTPSSEKFNESKIEIILRYNYLYGGYKYVASYEKGICKGHIVRMKASFKHINIFIKILAIVLSEILIFPYAIGALIYYFKCYKILEQLDSFMENNNFIKQNPQD